MSEHVTWTPGRDALAISAPNRSKMKWEDYLLSLKDKVREMSRKVEDPERMLEAAIAFHLGEDLSLSNPEEIVDSPVFQSHLKNRGLVNPSDFPVTISRVPLQDPINEMTLEVWIESLM